MNRKRFNFDSIGEAFRAGNRARKKESAQDTVEQPYSPEKTIEDFQKITGYELRYKDGWYEWGGEMHLENRLFSSDNNCAGLKTLPSPLRIKSCLYLKWCNDLKTLPDMLEIGGFLSIEYCTRLRSIGEHTKVYTDVYIKGCNSLDRLPLGLRFGRMMHLNDMSDGIVEDTPVVTFVKSLGIDPGTWGTVDAAQWPGNKRPVDEAFWAGNRARKKESAQDAVESVDKLQQQIDLFKEQTGRDLEIRGGRPYYNGYLDLYGRTGLTRLPDGLEVGGCLQLRDCTGLTSLPAGLKVEGGLFMAGCTGLTSLPAGLKVEGDLYMPGCTGLTSLPAGLEVKRELSLRNCTGLTSLPAGLKVEKNLVLTGCTGLTSLPAGLKVGGELWLGGCTGLTSLPSDLVVQGKWIVHKGILTPFFKKLRIPVDDDLGDTYAENWRDWQRAHGYLTEAFRAGNRARKKESVQDAVESVDKLQQQIDRFKEQTDIELEIRDGRPYFDGDLNLTDCTGLTSLPDELKVRYNLCIDGYTGLTSLPTGLEVGGSLSLYECTGLTSLPAGLKIGGCLFLRGCTRLTSLPAGLKVGGELWLENSGPIRLPFDLVVQGSRIINSGALTPFFRKLGIRVNKNGVTKTSDWREWQRAHGYLSEAFRAGNRARKKESAADATNETDSGFPGTGIDAFDDYFRTVYPTPESIQDSDFHTPEGLRVFFYNARNLLKKQYSIVKEDMNMDPCRLDLDWFRWFRGKLREFPQFTWDSHDNAAESVRSITIPEGTEVLVMRLGVFERLETVRLPDSLRKINVDAFSECCYLENVRFSGNLETIRTSAFYRCLNLGPIHIPASVRTIEFSAFEESGITEFVMDPDCQVEEIERNLCRLCTKLNRIELGNNVKWIKTLAFAFLGNVDEVILPAGLSQGVIEKNAFKNTRIKTVYIKGEDQYDNTRGLSGFESIKQKVLEAVNGGEPEFISIP